MRNIKTVVLMSMISFCFPAYAATNYGDRPAGSTLALLSDGDIVGTLMGGWNKYTSITVMDGGTISLVQGKWADAGLGGTFIGTMNGGTITLIDGGWDNQTYVGQMTGGTIGTITKDVSIDLLTGTGTIEKMLDSTKVKLMTGGTIELMDNGSDVYVMSGGTIKEMNSGTSVMDMSGGIIESAVSGAQIVAISDGTIKSMSAGAYVTAMTGGTIESMVGGTAVEHFSAGTIEVMDEFARIGIVKSGLPITGSMTGGIIEEMKGDSAIRVDMAGGRIKNMRNTSYVSKLITGTIENMYDTAHINAMTGGTVEKMFGGYIANMSGGSVGDVGAAAEIRNIENGTIYGNVENGTAFNVVQNGTLNLHADNTTKTFDRVVNAGIGATVAVKDYNLGTNAAFNMGGNGALFLGSVDVSKVTFAGTGSLSITSFVNNQFSSATIRDFAAHGEIIFNFFVNEAIGGNNDKLLIVSNTGSVNDHLIQVASHHTSTSNRGKIDLITDQSSSLSFQLANGDEVGLGAWNYRLISGLGNGGKQWSLLRRDILSDASTNLASIATANLTSVHSLQNALHKRMGDIRSQGLEGVWTRAYTNQTRFKSLSTTKVQNYATEVGYDKAVMYFDNSALSLGVSLGVNYARTEIKAEDSKDGGGNTTMPYMGIYGTWSSGDLYVDAILRYAYNDTDAYYYDGMNQRQDYKVNNHIGNLSVEVGYQHKVTEKFTLEPRAELSYTYIMSDTFMDDANFDGKYGATNSVLGTIGLLARYDFDKVETYAKVSYMRELDGRTDITYDDAKFDSDIRGGRGEIALGVTAGLDKDTSYFVEVGYQGGQKSYRNINGNIGLRWNF